MVVSILVVVLVLMASMCIYAATIFLSRRYNPGGRDPVDSLYSVTQWNPNATHVTSTCVVPILPGRCVIEGMTGAYQLASHTCEAGEEAPCIDMNTGENVKNGSASEFRIVCAAVPYCGWSRCLLSFSQSTYVQVVFKSNGVGNDPTLTLNSTGDPNVATPFFMERLAIDKKLVLSQNGTIARFRILSTDIPGAAAEVSGVYILTYNNSFPRPGGTDAITALNIRKENDIGSSFLTIFVLMESMPTSISTTSGSTSGLVARKILVFGGANRTQDPSIDELIDFNEHSKAKMWNNALTYALLIILWDSTSSPTNPGYYGLFPDNLYSTILNQWTSHTDTVNTVQDAIESRLIGNNHKFYNWIG